MTSVIYKTATPARVLVYSLLPWLLPCLLLSLMITSTGCSKKSSSDESAKINNVEIITANTQIAVNTSLQLNATAFYDNGEKIQFGTEVIWTSSNTDIATVSDTGKITATGTGEVIITAEYNDIIQQITLNVNDAELLALTISPSEVNLLQEQSLSLIVMGVFNDGSKQDLTQDVSWAVNDNTLLSMSANTATAILAGSTTITASKGELSSSVGVSIEAPSLVSIQWDIQQFEFIAGQTHALAVKGLFSNGKLYDITDNVEWQTSDDTIASIEDHIITFKQSGSVELSVSLGEISVTQSLNVIPAKLLSIDIPFIDSPLIAGNKLQLQAIGLYSNDKHYDITDKVLWSSDSVEIASISNAVGYEGRLTTYAASQVTVSATLGTISATRNVAVSDAILSAINITWQELTLAKGTRGQLIATGIYSDNSFKDITREVAWRVIDDNIALVDNHNPGTHFIYAVAPGTTQILAALGNISSQATITVSDATVVGLYIESSQQVLHTGAQHQLQAVATLSDGTTQYITEQVSWTSDTPQINVSNQANNAGLVIASGAGEAQISALFNQLSASINISATDKVIQSIRIETLKPAIAIGTSAEIFAIATFSDNSTADITQEVIFSSSNSNGLHLSNASGSRGQATAITAGDYVISISNRDNVNIATLTITVLDAVLDRIEISPRDITLAKGIISQLTATGIFTDNSQQDLTQQVLWQSSNETIVFVSNAAKFAGNLHTLNAGNAIISAVFNDKTAQSNLTVATNSLLNISLFAEDGVGAVPAGYRKSISAMANYADGSNQDVTEQVAWQILDASVCQFEDLINHAGIVITKKAGDCRISAVFNQQSASFIFPVNEVLLTSLSITPENLTLPKGLNTDIKVFGHYSDGSERDITADVTLQTSNNDLINLSSEASIVTAINEGTALLEVYHAGQFASAEIVISSASLSSITITSPFENFYKGRFSLFKAIGSFSDETTQDISSQVLWEINNDAIATIDNAHNFGILRASSGGELNIRATFAGVSQELPITIEDNPTIPVSISLNASPSAILNDAIETSTITVNVLAADNTQTVADNTAIKITVVNREGVTTQQLIYTTNGVANFTHSTEHKGISYIVAAVENSLIASYIAVYATDDLSQMIGRLRFAAATLTEDGLIKTGSAIGFYVINLSNREFDIAGFLVVSDDTVLYSSADPATPLGSNDMILSAGEALFLIYKTDNDVKNGVAAALYLTDQSTGQQLIIPQSFILAP